VNSVVTFVCPDCANDGYVEHNLLTPVGQISAIVRCCDPLCPCVSLCNLVKCWLKSCVVQKVCFASNHLLLSRAEVCSQTQGLPTPQHIGSMHASQEGTCGLCVDCDSRRLWLQAGKALLEVAMRGGDAHKLFFYTSPYRRSIETYRAMVHEIPDDRILGVQEEVQLREQDFGNFQDAVGKAQEKSERLRFGRFFYRFPNGESGADVYDRCASLVHGMRQFLCEVVSLGMAW
jgi:hypothetical protein